MRARACHHAEPAPKKQKAGGGARQQQAAEQKQQAVAAAAAGDGDGKASSRHKHHKHKKHKQGSSAQQQHKDHRPHYGAMTGPAEQDVWQSDDSSGKVGRVHWQATQASTAGAAAACFCSGSRSTCMHELALALGAQRAWTRAHRLDTRQALMGRQATMAAQAHPTAAAAQQRQQQRPAAARGGGGSGTLRAAAASGTRTTWGRVVL